MMFRTTIQPITDTAAIEEAFVLLAAGEIIAAPTDTVYGLMCLFDRADAIEKLYIAKGRPLQKAIPVLIGDVAQLAQLTPQPLPPPAQTLTHRFWPGPLTVVLPALPSLPSNLTAGQPTVGVRWPAHAALCALIRRAGPLAATSANRSGEPEARTAADVMDQLGGHVPLILAGDPPATRSPHVSAPSTVVDVTQMCDGLPKILRPGPLADAIRTLFAQPHESE